MSDVALRPDLVVWPREERLAAVPGRAPAGRHQALAGLAGLDWRLRRAWCRRREEAFQHAAVAGGTVATALATPRPGDLALARVREAFALARDAAGEAAREVTPAQVLALLRGCYLVLEPARRAPVVAVAAAVALRCGLAVHVACAGRESAAALLPLLRQAAGDATRVQLLAESPADREALADAAPAVSVGSASAFAHAWLRWGGEGSALARAASLLAGDAAPRFSFAPLLLCLDGDALLLDMLRHPLQLTTSRPDDAARYMQEMVAALAGFADGLELAAGQLAPAGEAALAAIAARSGGLWAVPGLRRRYAMAVLRARALVPEQDYVMENGRVKWRADPAQLAGDPAEAPVLELALRCLQGEPPPQRISRRAWFSDFYAGYARIGATGPLLADEEVDLWWLHGIVVLGNHPRRFDVAWSPLPLAALATEPGPVVLASRALASRPGLPAGLPCLEAVDARTALEAAVAAGEGVRVLGLPAAPRQLPAGLSGIIVACDDPLLPIPVLALARRCAGLGAAGRLLTRLLGRWLLARAARQRLAQRQGILLRGSQERRTYAFTGEAREA